MAVSDLTKLWDGHSESWQSGNQEIREEFRVDWDKRIETKEAMLGSSQSDFTWLTCGNVDMEPFGNASDAGGPWEAKLTATFTNPSASLRDEEDKPVENDWSGSSWTEHWEVGGDAITIGTGFKWTGAPTDDLEKDNVSAVMIHPSAVITLNGKTDRFNSAAKTLVLDVFGKVNGAAVTIKGHSYAARKLLFDGTDANQGTNQDGTSDTHTMTYKFLYRHISDWNTVYREKTGEWDKPLNKLTGEKMYSDALFSDLDPANW
jgi:hypothetical protein